MASFAQIHTCLLQCICAFRSYVYIHIHPLHAHACPFIVLRYTTTCTAQTIYNYFLVHGQICNSVLAHKPTVLKHTKAL